MDKSKTQSIRSLFEITEWHLKKYWDRENRLVIVKFSDGHCLVFLVEDAESPEVPGYPANPIETFESYEEASQGIKDCYTRLAYTPKHVGGIWTKVEPI